MRRLTEDINGGTVVARTRFVLTITGQDLIEDRLKVTNGESLMQYISHRFQRQLTLLESSSGETLRAPDNKRFYPVFRW